MAKIRLGYVVQKAKIRYGWDFLLLKMLKKCFKMPVPYFSIFKEIKPQPYLILAFSIE